MTNEEIEKLITSAPGRQEGKVVQGATAAQVRHLQDCGLVGPNGGLTRKGSIKATKAWNDSLDRLFG